MKKIISMILILFAIVFTAKGQNVDFNEQNALQLKEVVQTPNMTKNQIFVTAQSMLSDWHPNANSQLSIDFSDLETGTIITKGRYFLGYREVFVYGHNVYADFSCTIKIKDGRTQITLKVPSLTLHWTADNDNDETIDIIHAYPQYDGYKTWMKGGKKTLTQFGPKVPDAMRLIFKSISDRISKSAVDDDF